MKINSAFNFIIFPPVGTNNTKPDRTQKRQAKKTVFHTPHTHIPSRWDMRRFLTEPGGGALNVFLLPIRLAPDCAVCPSSPPHGWAVATRRLDVAQAREKKEWILMNFKTKWAHLQLWQCSESWLGRNTSLRSDIKMWTNFIKFAQPTTRGLRIGMWLMD